MDIKKGADLTYDFKFDNSFASTDSITASNVTVTFFPPSQVSYTSPVVPSALIIPVLLNATNGVEHSEYLVEVTATSDAGRKDTLHLILTVKPLGS